MSSEKEIRVDAQRLRAFTSSIFTKLGVGEEESRIWTDVLIEASLRGVDSHGILVLPMYASIIEAGGIALNATMNILRDNGPTLLLDGGNGIGPVIANRAMELALERARQYGLSFVVVRNSNHFGIAGYYAMKSLALDMIGLAFTNAGPALAAWGGRTKVIGSNALGIAVPAGKELPLVFDAAIGSAAGAKIFLAAEKGELIPADWMIDKYGNATDDPKALLNGGVVIPFGRHKGYGLGVITDVLTGVISGGLFSTHVKSFAQDSSEPDGVCHSFAALDIKSFIPVADFNNRMDEMIRNIKKSERREGFDQILLPGERGFSTYDDRQRSGIPLHAKLVEDLRRLGQRLSTEFAF